MYVLKQLNSNLIVVELIKQPERKVNGLIMPNQKGHHRFCKVIAVGREVKNPEIKVGDIISVKTEVEIDGHLDNDTYSFQEKGKEYRLITEYMFDMIVEEVSNVIS